MQLRIGNTTSVMRVSKESATLGDFFSEGGSSSTSSSIFDTRKFNSKVTSGTLGQSTSSTTAVKIVGWAPSQADTILDTNKAEATSTGRLSRQPVNLVALSTLRWNLVKIEREWDSTLATIQEAAKAQENSIEEEHKAQRLLLKKRLEKLRTEQMATVAPSGRLNTLKRKVDNLRRLGRTVEAEAALKRLKSLEAKHWRDKLGEIGYTAEARKLQQTLQATQTFELANVHKESTRALANTKRACVTATLTQRRHNKRSSDDPWSVWYAAKHGEMERLEKLCKLPGSLELRDPDTGWSPLHFSAREGQLEATEWLIDHGAFVDAQGPEGRTALHLSAGWGTSVVCMALLVAGADTHVTDNIGLQPVDLARHRGRGAVAAMLERWLPLGLTSTQMELMASAVPMEAWEKEDDSQVAQQMRVLQLKSGMLGPKDPSLISTLARLSSRLKALGRKEEALDYSLKLLDVAEHVLESEKTAAQQIVEETQAVEEVSPSINDSDKTEDVGDYSNTLDISAAVEIVQNNVCDVEVADGIVVHVDSQVFMNGAKEKAVSIVACEYLNKLVNDAVQDEKRRSEVTVVDASADCVAKSLNVNGTYIQIETTKELASQNGSHIEYNVTLESSPADSRQVERNARMKDDILATDGPRTEQAIDEHSTVENVPGGDAHVVEVEVPSSTDGLSGVGAATLFLSVALNNVGEICHELMLDEEAAYHFEQALAVLKGAAISGILPGAQVEVDGSTVTSMPVHHSVAPILLNLGLHHFSRGHPSEAVASLSAYVSLRAKDLWTPQAIHEPYELIPAIDLLAYANLLAGDTMASLRGYQRSLRIARDKFGPNSVELMRRHENMGMIHYMMQKYEDSIKHFRRAQILAQLRGDPPFGGDMARLDLCIAQARIKLGIRKP